MPAPQKRGRIKLPPAEYAALKQKVLERDGWQCRRCGARRQLQVHHIIKRSDIRIDVSWNLVVLCAVCHEKVERHEVDILGSDADALNGLAFRYRSVE